jgi:excinuclease ABC subunit C
MLRLDLDERFPRLKHVRERSPEEGRPGGRARFFGPYASSGALTRALSALQRVVPLRDCPDHVLANRSRPCLKHQLGLCAAPCVGLIDERGYAELVERAARVLSGDVSEIAAELEARMRAASKARDYERAAAWRDRLAALRQTAEGQGVRTPDRVRRDVLGLARAGESAVVHRLSFRDGQLADSRSHAFRSQLDDEELLHVVLTALYGAGRREAPDELVLPCKPADAELLRAVLGKEVTFAVPRSGERLRMLHTAGENARAALERESIRRAEEQAALEELARLTALDAPPEVVDCFDVSNFQGAHVVASRVRFRRGIPDRAGYRRFKVRGVEGQDDFASMREVVLRSLRRGVEQSDLPDLIVIDGGAQQLESALAARDEAGAWDVALVALAKARVSPARGARAAGHPDRAARASADAVHESPAPSPPSKDERLFLPGAKEPIPLPPRSPARHLLERLRDEAHRFAITYHRKERGRISSRLDAIPGVGPVRRRALLKAFGSVQGVRAAGVEQIAAVPGIGPELARAIDSALRAPDAPREG